VGFRKPDVSVEIPLGINDDGFAVGAYYIRIVSKAWHFYAMDLHAYLILLPMSSP